MRPPDEARAYDFVAEWHDRQPVFSETCRMTSPALMQRPESARAKLQSITRLLPPLCATALPMFGAKSFRSPAHDIERDA